MKSWSVHNCSPETGVRGLGGNVADFGVEPNFDAYETPE